MSDNLRGSQEGSPMPRLVGRFELEPRVSNGTDPVRSGVGGVLHFISLGAGVQSSTMALMAAKGEFKALGMEMPAAAIFADTQSEPKAVYEWLDWLEKELPFPVHRVTVGNLGVDELRVRRSKKSGKLYLRNSIPAFVKKPDGRKGLLGRKCTSDYKIVPLQRKVKELVGIKRAVRDVRAIMWIGISRDECHRMKPSRASYIENVWPLIDMSMTRTDCLQWMSRNGYPIPPRSACTFCPFHSDFEWRNLKENHPEDFEFAVRFERDLIAASQRQEVLKGTPYLHESLVPLDEVDFQANPSHGQLSLFGNECEGMCGV